MKRMLMMMSILIGIAHAQLPVFSVDTVIVDCHQGMVHSTVLNSGNPTDGYFYLDYYDNGWQNAGISWNSTGDVSWIDMTFSGIGEIIHTYDSLEIMYYHPSLSDTITIAQFGCTCIGVGIEDNEDKGTIIKTEYYNLSGQLIKEVVNEGIYVRIDYYDTGRQKRSKVYETSQYK